MKIDPKRRKVEPGSQSFGYIPQSDGSHDFSAPLQSNEKGSAEAWLRSSVIPQSDGTRDSGEIPHSYGDDDDDDDYNVPGPSEAAELVLSNAATPGLARKGGEESSSSLSDSDDDDDLEGVIVRDEDPKTDNLVLATYEKVSRVKNRWKCVLKDCILNLNGRDFLASKATGEFDF